MYKKNFLHQTQYTKIHYYQMAMYRLSASSFVLVVCTTQWLKKENRYECNNKCNLYVIVCYSFVHLNIYHITYYLFSLSIFLHMVHKSWFTLNSITSSLCSAWEIAGNKSILYKYGGRFPPSHFHFEKEVVVRCTKFLLGLL